MAQIRQRGTAALVLCSHPFRTLAQSQARIHGVPLLPLALVAHPLGGLVESFVMQRADEALPQVMALLRELAP